MQRNSLKCSLALVLCLCGPAFAQLPATRLGVVFPPGGTTGATFDVTIAGEDLDDVNALRFSHAGISAKQKLSPAGPFDKAPAPVPNTFEVTIAANVPEGVYDVRCTGKYGTSNPRAFTVCALPQAIEVEPNDQREAGLLVSLPAVLNGQADRAADVDWWTFEAAAGQRLLIDCRARRIDSLMDPIVTLFDAAGRELGSNRGGQAGDPLLDVTLPSNGRYHVRVADALYRGNDGRAFYFYRLSVGVLTHLDFVFPPAGTPGSNGRYTVYGRNLPGGQRSNLTMAGKPLDQLDVSIAIPAGDAAQMLPFSSRVDPETAGLDGVEHRIKGANNLSNPLFVGIAGSPVVVEAEPNNTAKTAQKILLPCEIAGQFYPQRDEDWFAFDAKQGDQFWIEVLSQRLGAATDPLLLIQQVTVDAEGKEQISVLATVDDFAVPDAGRAFDIRSDDPAFRFTAPADATYRLLVRDSYNGFQSDPRSVYRLMIRPAQPDFRLAAAPSTQSGGLFLRKGGSEAIQVVAWRRDGFDGEITVTAAGLPNGVTCPPIVIGPTQTSAQLVLAAADNAPAATGFIQISGKAKIGNAEVTRPARAGTLIWPLQLRQNNQQVIPSGEARLCSDIAVSISDLEAAPVLVTAGQNQVWETSRGGILKIPYAVTRRNNFKDNVALIARELPANIPAPLVNAGGNQGAGEYELRLTSTTPTGTYTFYFDAFAQNVSYARNPEAAKAAADRKAEFEKINAAAIAAAQKALVDKQAADKLAADAAAAVKVAETAKETADKAAAAAASALQAATAKATEAKAAAAANKDDANLAAALAAADKAVADVTAVVKTTNEAAAAAQKKLDESLAAQKAADEAKVKTDAANEEAIAFAKLAADAKTRADQAATAAEAAARPVNRNVFVPSSSITLKVTEAPIKLTVRSPAAPLKQGAMVEVPVSIERLYGCNDAVNLTMVLQGVGGLAIPNVSIPAGQTAAAFTIRTAADATVGKHKFIVRATLTFNGQGLTVDVPIELTIEKTETQPT